MSKFEAAKDLLELHKLVGRLAQEAIDALELAKQDLTIENLTEAIRKTDEYQLCRANYQERLENWTTN